MRSISRAVIGAFAAAFVVFGADDARAFTFCRAKPDGETIRGFFITTERKTRLDLFSTGPNSGCQLRHDGGPTSDALSWTDGAVFVGVCRDSVTGRDWAMVYRSAGQHADLGFWSVDPVTRAVEHEYEETWTVWGLEEDQYGEVVADGACLARERRAGQALLLEAMLALRPGNASGSEGRDEQQFNIPVGTSLKLATRVIPEDEVRWWLLDLNSVRPAVVKFEGARYADEAARESWSVIQVLGTRLDEAPGVVLVLDRARHEWRAIYEVLSGGAKRLNFPMYDMVVNGDRLYATLCTYCSSWGNYGTFEIDLSTHRATRLEKAPELGIDDEGNQTIHAIEKALKALDENRFRTIELKDSHGFNQFSLAYSRDRITIDGLRMRLSLTRRECNAHILDSFNSEMSKLVTKFISENRTGSKVGEFVMMDLKIEIDNETYISSNDLKMGRSLAHLPEEIVRMKWEEKFNCSSD